MLELRKIIANNIYILRNEYKLTQQEFADKLNIGVSRGHISHIENGTNIPSAEFIKAVCVTFNVSADWLLKTISDPLNPQALSNKELNLIKKFNYLTEVSQNLILQLIEELLKS